MKIKDAVVERLLQVCNERDIVPNELAVRSGVTPSTVYSLIQPVRKDMSVITLKKLCDGLDMSLAEFFDSSIFTAVEQEIV